MTTGWAMLLATLALVLAGCGLYVAGLVGWAQALWVFASGTAGASVVFLLEERR
jgi:hypothetical protein